MVFTWVDNERLAVSRVDESEWSNDSQRRPEPTLGLIQLNMSQQKGDIWIADLNGKNAKMWAKDVEQYSFYVKYKADQKAVPKWNRLFALSR
ncbi:hypothetical protein [Cytobacillus firmus]|uniref:hypothetical protein n=1 Tax=Cytobacillus firmus TaxID=1399 RepID=UPI0022282804|nr:hypothetical protein [Cytobacillus firmus]